MPQTLLDKIWEAHEVAPGLLYIDLHLVHEVTSPQAFDGLRLAGRAVRRPDRTLATADHNVPTDGTHARRARSATSSRACRSRRSSATASEFGIPLYSMGSDRQGIVHVIGPELGVTQPGMTIVCGDSHTATHGAFGALAFGIGTSEVEHVLATQCLVQTKPRSMRIRYEGDAGFGVTAKDLILATIGQIGVAGAVGHAVEYSGPAIAALSMEGRMTLCNMTIEGGGRAGMVAPDDVDLRVVRADRAARSPRGPSSRTRSRAGGRCAPTTAPSFDREVVVDAAAISPQVTWGTNPGMVVGVAGRVPGPGRLRRRRPTARRAERALHYMGLEAGHADRGDPPRPRVHRLVHELADRRPARRRRR